MNPLLVGQASTHSGLKHLRSLVYKERRQLTTLVGQLPVGHGQIAADLLGLVQSLQGK